MSDAYILDAVRTPFGRYGGALAKVRPDDLGAHVVKALARAARPTSTPRRSTTSASATPTARARTTATSARMAVAARRPADERPRQHRQPPVRLEPRRRDAGQPRDRDRRRRRRARRRRRVDEPRAVGACSSPRRASRPARRRCTRRRSAGAWSTRTCPTSGRSRSARAPRSSPASTSVGREAQDAFALRSHQRADAAWDAGFYDDWVSRSPDTELSRDEGIRADSSLEKLAKLKPAFVKDGTVTAGNASPLNDGASAVLIAQRGGRAEGGRADRPDRRPRRRSPSTPTSSASARSRRPTARSSAPASRWGDVDAVELNEAFAAQSLACVGEWKDLDPERVNVNGGAIAIGHPLGASGGRILGTLAYTLKANGWKYGRRRDLHRRRPGPRGRAGGGVTTFRDDTTSHPPLDYPGYKSTALRHPKQPLIALPHRLTEVTAPVLGEDRLGELDHDLTRQHEGEPHGPADHRPRPRQGGRRPPGARTRWSRSGRPTPAAATATAGTTGRRRSTRTSPASAAA